MKMQKGSFLPGDANMDGELTAGDALMVFEMVLGLRPEPAGVTPFCAADCNANNTIEVSDVQNIFQAVLMINSCAEPIN